MLPTPPTTHYVIVGQQRTGSNLINGMLRQNPEVTAFGEIFSSRNRIQDQTEGEELSILRRSSPEALVEERNADPVAFVERYLYCSGGASRARGFKLFYEHYSQKNFPALRPWLEEGKSIQVIHLRRMNLLRTLLSKRLAARSGVWKIEKSQASAEMAAPEIQPIELKLDDCAKFFERSFTAEREADYMLRHHRKLDVYYEDLAADPQGACLAICAFLRVPAHAAEVPIQKQTLGKLSEIISNYGELKQAFAKHHCSHFFED